MSVASIGQDIYPPRLIEEYPDLEPYTLIEVRKNDVEVPVGSLGTVLRTVPETGNYQCAVKIETDQGPRRRVVALTHDQVRPIGPAPAAERPALELVAMAHDPEDKERQREALVKSSSAPWSEERRAKFEATWAKKREAKARAAADRQAAVVDDISDDAPAAAPAVTGSPVENAFAAAAADEIAAFRAVKAERETRRVAPLGAPQDWMAEAADAVRQVLGRAAGGASAAELRALLSLIELAEGVA